MRHLDAAKAYLAVRVNGWGADDAVKAAGMVFSSGGFSGLGEYFPNRFNKLTDPWPARAGLGSFSVDAIWSNSTAQACLAWLQRNFTEARIRVVEGEGADAEEVKNHPLTRLLNRPNPFDTPDNLWEATLADWWILGSGNVYWKKVRDAAGQPTELWPIPAREIEPKWPQDGSKFISHYERTVNGQKKREEVRDIVHFRFSRDPNNNRKGYSPLGAGGAEIGMLNSGATYRSAILTNHGVPSYALTPREEAVARQMTPEKQELLTKLFQSKFGGENRAAGLFIPNFVADLTRVGFSPQELDIRRMMEWDADTVCALFGLSSMVVGLPSGEGQRTYSNLPESREAAVEVNIVPTQARFAAVIERALLPDFDKSPNRHVGWDYSNVRVLQEDQNKVWERLDGAWARGAITRAEAKQAKGLEVDEKTDRVYLIPSTGTIVSADETPEEREAKQVEKDKQELEAAVESRGDAAVNGGGRPMNGNGARVLNGNGAKALPMPATVTPTRRDVAAAEAAFSEAVGVEFSDLLSAEATDGNGS